jgi:hypothetical protein
MGDRPLTWRPSTQPLIVFCHYSATMKMRRLRSLRPPIARLRTATGSEGRPRTRQSVLRR